MSGQLQISVPEIDQALFESLAAAVSELRVLVVGDVSLDKHCYYDPELTAPSLETGLPCLAVVRRYVAPGAGGNVARNAAALGPSEVALVSVIGDDGEAYDLRRALERDGVSQEGLVVDAARQTFTYMKIHNAATGKEDRGRIDFVNTKPLAPETEEELVRRIGELIGEADVVLIADQAETEVGVVTDRVREVLIEYAAAHPEKVFMADSRRRIHLFKGIVAKPNVSEAARALAELALGAEGAEREVVEQRAQQLQEAIGQGRPLFVTVGPDGALVVDGGGVRRVPTLRDDQPVDITGAGDSFAAGAALFMAAARKVLGEEAPELSALMGNLAASVTIKKPGTGTCSRDELCEALERFLAGAEQS